MNDTFDYISRFFAVLFGFCCAMLVAGWFLAAILYSRLDLFDLVRGFFIDLPPGMQQASFTAAVLVGGTVLAALAGGFSFAPAAVFILVAEARGWKSSLAYCLAGLAIGLAASTTRLFIDVDGQTGQAELWRSPLMLAGLASAGVVGGFVYWLVAGRNAGRLNRPAA